MVEIADILAPDSVIVDLRTCHSKRQVLKELAAHAAAVVGVDQQRLLEALMERERLGTTGIGHGIAIPHARMTEVKKLVGLFARLDHPVDFEALDDQPSDSDLPAPGSGLGRRRQPEGARPHLPPVAR